MKVICFLFDPNVGGPTIRARAVYERMIENGYDVRIAFPKGKGSAVGYVEEKNIPVDQLNLNKPVLPRKKMLFLKFVASSPFGLFNTYRYLRRENPDVIHVNGAFDFIPAVAGWLARTPVVWHLNDTVFSQKFSRSLGRFVKFVSSTIITAADRVGKHYGVMDFENRITIHAPVDVDRFFARNVDDFPRAMPRVTLIANWNWIKSQDRFVQVISEIKKAGVDVKGFIAGKFLEGQESFWEPILQEISTLDLGNVIETPGFVADTVKVLHETDILLLTSHSEASPICVHEAMSVGVPSVVFDVGGVREILGSDFSVDQELGRAGEVVEQGAVDEMAKAVVRILDNKSLYTKMSLNGQMRARKNFSLEACIKRHEKAYEMASSTYQENKN